MKKIKFDEIKKKLKLDKIVEFLKSRKIEEHHIKIIAAVVAVLLIVGVLFLAFGRDNSLFPERDWTGFLPNKEETTTTTAPEEETTPEETTDDGVFDDSNIGEWLPVN